MIKHYPKFLSALGILGIATAVVFLTGVILSFIPGNPTIAAFFVGKSDLERSFAFLLVAIPYVLLIAHLYLRTHAGQFFLRRGEVGLAKEYCEARLRVTPGRGKLEVAYHRLYLGQAAIREGAYSQALSVLREVKPPYRLLSEYFRWEMEALLRMENLKDAKELCIHLERFKNAAFYAAAAELSFRQGETEKAAERLKDARWIDDKDPRVAATAILLNDVKDDETLERALIWADQVPGAALELYLAAGRDAGEHVKGSADSRSKYVLSKTEVHDG